MILLTQCAACAAPLGFSSGKKCGRCSTRYCGPECQEQHWKEGGHDQLCKKIKKAGGAEQYNANKKYGEAVAVAAEACAEDTKGQTCYICTQALHWKTKEGLVRGCSCRGTAGFAHVSCLAEQAKILREEAEERNLGIEARNARWLQWYTCSLCEQEYHGVVKCALGWACWKTYVGRPEPTDRLRSSAMCLLGNGLDDARLHEDALVVREAEWSMRRRFGASENDLLIMAGNLATSYYKLGRLEQALNQYRVAYSSTLKIHGEEHSETLRASNNYANTLASLKRFEEAKALLRKTLPVARRVLGDCNDTALTTRWIYARALYNDDGATLDDLREAVETLEDTVRIVRRVFGAAHPLTPGIEGSLQNARAALRSREAPPTTARDDCLIKTK